MSTSGPVSVISTVSKCQCQLHLSACPVTFHFVTFISSFNKITTCSSKIDELTSPEVRQLLLFNDLVAGGQANASESHFLLVVLLRLIQVVLF
ncbi:hypothetical protein FOCC_FOCC005435 [Frankliniella occidentalis]|nr:hypothetical protein FOCC_FOCC005435 [Frankliniella occidentalis]